MKQPRKSKPIAVPARSARTPAPVSADRLLTDVRALIEAARHQVAQAVNTGLVVLYWHVGKRIREDVLGNDRAEYGRQVLQTLSTELTAEYGNGFTRSSLSRMMRFAEVFPDEQIVAALSQQLGWSHFVEPPVKGVAGSVGGTCMSKAARKGGKSALAKRASPTPPTQADLDVVLDLIESARTRAVAAVNSALVDLYWSIGQQISRRVADEEWGRGTVELLAEAIQSRYPTMRGYSASNLWRMKQFFETYRDQPKLATLLRELSWSHNLAIMSRSKRDEEREFYLGMAVREGWSFRDLHPSSLHLWRVRRPLAACRAVLFASLVDDPSSAPMFAGDEYLAATGALP